MFYIESTENSRNKSKDRMHISPLWYLLLSLTLVSSSSLILAKEPTRHIIEEIQQLGLQANGLVQAARSQVNIAEANVVSASAFRNPEVTFMYGPQSNRLPSSVTGPSNNQHEVTVSQPIENPFFDLHVLDLLKRALKLIKLIWIKSAPIWQRNYASVRMSCCYVKS